MLPQKPASIWRKFNLRRYITWSGLPFLGMVAAFGAFPQSGTDPSKLKTVVDEIVLPQPATSGNATTFWHIDQTQTGDTVAELLHRLGVEDSAAEKFLRTNKSALSFRQLTAGHGVQAETAANGNLLTLRYLSNSGEQTMIERTSKGFAARSLPTQLEQRLFIRTGTVKGTLIAAADDANLPEPILNQLTSIYASTIDFYHDIKPGDRFSVIYEVAYSNGDPIYTGRILAAEFTLRNKVQRALYFQPGEGEGDYYTPEGHSLHRAFLRSPVSFSRISSGYSSSRLHPILHKWGAHRGIDFAAPEGTPVHATSAGTITFAGVQGGYGKVVMLKHQGSYSTVYGHLSRIPSHLHAGQAVIQNEVIGYVGMTGLATGPHLHYEFRVDGKPRNPLTAAPVESPSIDNLQRDAYLTATHDLHARLEMLHTLNLAQAN